MLAFVLRISVIFLGPGVGGMERMIVYPELAFVIGLGGYLMGTEGRLKSSRGVPIRPGIGSRGRMATSPTKYIRLGRFLR